MNNPRYVLGDDEKPILDSTQKPVVVTTRYLSVKIQNTGHTVAHNVTVSVTKLTHWRQTTGSEEFDEEVMDLPVARHVQKLDLPPGGYRYMDVFSAWNYNGPCFKFAFVTPSIVFICVDISLEATERISLQQLIISQKQKPRTLIGIGISTARPFLKPPPRR